VAGAGIVAQATVAIDENGFHRSTITESLPGQTDAPLRHNRGLTNPA
jgi:hypothetical protein